MPLFAESEAKIFGDMLFDIVNDTGITRASTGSKTRAIAEALSKKLGQMYQVFDLNMIHAFLPTAQGKYLDFIGQMLNVSRLGEETAVLSVADKNIRFYVDVGTFGDINGGNSILVPAGTIISTVAAGGGIAYRLVISTILDSAASEGYVPAEAINTGSRSNLGQNTLIYHTFTNYTDTINESLKVSNDAEIVSGKDVESDTNYRYRIANQVLAAEAANATAIRLAALSVPGVADLVMLRHAKGIGTFDILIQSTTPSVPVSLISAVTESVRLRTAAGNVGLIRAPVEIGMSLVGTLTLSRAVSASEEADILNTVTINITDYINNLDIGEEFIVNEAIERAMGSSDLIKNLGSASKPFDNLYIYRPSRLEDNKVRSNLLGDFAPVADEKVIVETVYAGTTPILFRLA